MVALTDIVRHPSRMVPRPARQFVSRPPRGLTRNRYRIGGLVLLGLLLAGFIWAFPELRRYARIERM